MTTSNYGLSFISDTDLFQHTKKTIDIYLSSALEKKSLKALSKNILDPIKLTFDKLVFNASDEIIITSEILRQIDKTNTNQIGYFNQHIFKYVQGVSSNWQVPAKGWDIENAELKIFCEMKNKHNTMNSSSSQKTYIRMASKINAEPSAYCYLVEIIAVKSQDITWNIRVDDFSHSDKRIRRISIDKFYELVTGQSNAFAQLCTVLPTVLSDIVTSYSTAENTTASILKDLSEIHPHFLTALYRHAFKTYEGFGSFECQ
jgi:hypothetical protein